MSGTLIKKGDYRCFERIEEHTERFHGKRPGLFARLVRLKVLVIGSVMVVGMLLTIIMSLD